jgi:RNA polymerase sigma-70 factor (ECF subfamily)
MAETSLALGALQDVTDAETAEERLRVAIHSYHAPLYGFLRVMLGDHESAEDALQETFARAYHQVIRGKPLTAAWLYKVAHNLAVDDLRRRQRLRRTESFAAFPDQETAAPEIARPVWEALAQLSPSDRELLYLADVDGLSAAEIGQALGIRPGAVRTRLSRAHQRFRAVYRDDR